jgi:hypothetical protein
MPAPGVPKLTCRSRTRAPDPALVRRLMSLLRVDCTSPQARAVLSPPADSSLTASGSRARHARTPGEAVAPIARPVLRARSAATVSRLSASRQRLRPRLTRRLRYACGGPDAAAMAYPRLAGQIFPGRCSSGEVRSEFRRCPATVKPPRGGRARSTALRRANVSPRRKGGSGGAAAGPPPSADAEVFHCPIRRPGPDARSA